MKVIGIIAEYNPFHNGHACQIEELKRKTGADYIVAAMSGDFVQRGAPAIVDKYTRARMALTCGIDLVCELPVLWATSSAEDFAMAGVTLFEKMGCVCGICFGAETDDLELLASLADVLAEEPEPYRDRLSEGLRQGMSFPLARAAALYGYLADHPFLYDKEHSDLSSLLECPNNILAIEYLKAMKRRGSQLTPYLIPRRGARYHDTTINFFPHPDYVNLSAHMGASQLPCASATAIRQRIRDTVGDSVLPCDASELAILPADLLCSMPQEATRILSDCLKKSPAVYTDDLSSILGYQLLVRAKDGFADILGANEELSNRMQNLVSQYNSFPQFCELLKTRNVTYTRVRRVLTHLLLGLDTSRAQAGTALDYIPYLRMLGFRKAGANSESPLFSAIKKSSSVPLLSKLADAEKLLSMDALSMLEDDVFAANLYEQVRHQKMRKAAPDAAGYHMWQKEQAQEIIRI